MRTTAKFGTGLLRISHLFVQSFWNLKQKFQHRVEDTIFCPLTTESQPLLNYSEKTINIFLRRYWLYEGLKRWYKPLQTEKEQDQVSRGKK